MISVLLLGALGFAVFSLAQAMIAMARGPDSSGAVAWALTRRIVISVLLFVFLVVGWKFGWLEPHAL